MSETFKHMALRIIQRMRPRQNYDTDMLAFATAIRDELAKDAETAAHLSEIWDGMIERRRSSSSVENRVVELKQECDDLRQQLADIKRPDFREMREMLRAMQAGELTVSRGIEILEMWSAGNWNDDMLPPIRQGLIEEDSMPVEIINRLKIEIESLRQQLAEKDAEIKRLKGDTYAGLDVYPNNTESEQQRKLVGSVEMGQLLERGEDEGAGNTKTQGVIVLAGTDEYGPILRWYTHWVDFEVGSEFYSYQQLATIQAREQQLRAHLEVIAGKRVCVDNCLGNVDIAELALAQPSDTTALKAIIAKAGEVMRERCRILAWATDENLRQKTIRALPQITLDDIK